jgi:signal transduction histidine kinase
MSLKNRIPVVNSVAFRLTLTYALICTGSLLAVMTVSYLALQSTLQRRLDEVLVSEIWEYGSLLKTQEFEVLRDVLVQEAVSEGTDRVFFRVLHKTGETILATDMSAWDDVGVAKPHLLSAMEGTTVFETHHHPSRVHPVRIVYGPVGPDLVMQLGESTVANAAILQHFRQVFGFGILGFVVCSMGVGLVMARRALGGVRRVTQAARDISSGGWDSRVPVSHRYDEIDELAASFNEMVERIQILIRELKEVTDDIAHDLRTPVTRMRIVAESALAHFPESGTPEDVAGHVLEECDHLLELINTMLEISQTEAGAWPLARERTDVSLVAEELCDLFQPASEDKKVALSFSGQTGLLVDGDAKRLTRAMAHILDNAVKYTAPDGAVSVECALQNGAATVSVRDTGAGIPEENLDKIFARFYRVDKSRAETGNGLGLSLSRAILKAHGGDVTVSSVLGEGSTFVLTLPLVAK